MLPRPYGMTSSKMMVPTSGGQGVGQYLATVAKGETREIPDEFCSYARAHKNEGSE